MDRGVAMTPRSARRPVPKTPGTPGVRSPGAETIRVVARVRPLLPSELQAGEELSVQLRGNDIMVSSVFSGAPSVFRMDQVVVPEESQEDVFEIIKPQLSEALGGFNTTVFAVRVPRPRGRPPPAHG